MIEGRFSKALIEWGLEFNKGKRDINKKGKGLNREGDSGSKGGNVIEGWGLIERGVSRIGGGTLKRGVGGLIERKETLLKTTLVQIFRFNFLLSTIF